MHGTKEGRHSNHGPQLVLKLNAFNVFSVNHGGKPNKKSVKGNMMVRNTFDCLRDRKKGRRDRHIDRKTHNHMTDRQTDRSMDGWMDGEKDRKIDRQIDRKIDGKKER
jgi:hypothetical protein